MSITDYFANLGNPQARKEIFQSGVQNAVRTVFPGAVKSPATGTAPQARASTAGKSKASAPFLKFANDRSTAATALATEAGFAPPQEEEPGYIGSIISTESGGNFGAQNSEVGAGGNIGHFGRSQFGIARLQDAKNAGVMPANMTPGEFLASPETQKAVEAWHYADLERNLSDLVGAEVNGKPMTIGGLVAMGHLGGAGGARKFVESGGSYNPADSFGTSLADYAAKHGGATGDFLATNSGLQFDPAIRPVNDSDLGRGASDYSMGMSAADFTTLKEKYGERQAMEILNSTQTDATVPYDDAIMRFLQEGAAEPAPPVTAPSLAAQGLSSNSGDYSLGTPMPAPVSATENSASGGGGGVRPTAASKSTEEQPNLTAVDRMMNAVYGTAVDDMSDDERADRRRAVGQAMTQGFQLLSRGTPMDIQPIVAQKMELQQVRRAAADLKQNAQGVSDMLVAAGMDEMAQLPFMGENGMNASLQMLTTVGSREATAASQPFDVSPQMRATMAQTLSDMGYAGPAELVMNTGAGDAFKEVWNNAVGVSTRATAGEGGTTETPYTPEKKAAAASIARANGNEALARGIENDLISPGDVSTYLLEIGKVPLAGEQAGLVAAAQAGVDEQVDQRSAEQIAAGYTQAGLLEEAAIARAANSGPEATQAIEAFRANKAVVAEEKLRQTNNAAMVAAIPDDAENAEEMRALAANAVTDGDRQRVYEMFKKDEKTITQRDFEYAEKEEGYLGFIFDMKRAEHGEQTYSFAEQLNMNTITAVSEQQAATRAARIEMHTSVDTIRSAIVNPDYDMGPVQGVVLNTYQEWANSILGDRAPVFREDDELTTDAIIEQVQNKLFAAATADLKGAVSDRETGYARATLVATTDLKMQALAKLQMMERLPEIQAAEYAAMLKWTNANMNNIGDAEGMIAFINKEVGHMKVFDTVTPGDSMDAWFDDPARELGDVVSVMRPDGSSFLQAFIVE